jgi:hypothetical protein
MITGQYNNYDFTTRHVQIMLPTLVPVLIAEPFSYKSDKITNTLKPLKTNMIVLPVTNPPI